MKMIKLLRLLLITMAWVVSIIAPANGQVICSICPNGGTPLNRYVDFRSSAHGSLQCFCHPYAKSTRLCFPFFLSDTVVLTEDDGVTPITCSDIDRGAGQGAFDQELCDFIETFATQCGCSSSTTNTAPSTSTAPVTSPTAESDLPDGTFAPCSVCYDGSFPIHRYK
jgi:hypothetical protein